MFWLKTALLTAVGVVALLWLYACILFGFVVLRQSLSRNSAPLGKRVGVMLGCLPFVPLAAAGLVLNAVSIFVWTAWCWIRGEKPEWRDRFGPPTLRK